MIGLCTMLSAPLLTDILGLPPAPPPPEWTLTLDPSVVTDVLGLPPPEWTLTLDPSVVTDVLGLDSMWAVPIGIGGLSMVFLGVAAALAHRRRSPSAHGHRKRTKAPRQPSTRRSTTVHAAAEKPRRGRAGAKDKKDVAHTTEPSHAPDKPHHVPHPDLAGNLAPRQSTRKGIADGTAAKKPRRGRAGAMVEQPDMRTSVETNDQKSASPPRPADERIRAAAAVAAARDHAKLERGRAEARAMNADKLAMDLDRRAREADGRVTSSRPMAGDGASDSARCVPAGASASSQPWWSRMARRPFVNPYNITPEAERDWGGPRDMALAWSNRPGGDPHKRAGGNRPGGLPYRSTIVKNPAKAARHRDEAKRWRALAKHERAAADAWSAPSVIKKLVEVERKRAKAADLRRVESEALAAAQAAEPMESARQDMAKAESDRASARQDMAKAESDLNRVVSERLRDERVAVAVVERAAALDGMASWDAIADRSEQVAMRARAEHETVVAEHKRAVERAHAECRLADEACKRAEAKNGRAEAACKRAEAKRMAEDAKCRAATATLRAQAEAAKEDARLAAVRARSAHERATAKVEKQEGRRTS